MSIRHENSNTEIVTVIFLGLNEIVFEQCYL